MFAVQVLRKDLSELPHQLASLSQHCAALLHDFGCRQFIPLRQPTKRFPGVTALLASSIKPFEQQSPGLPIILRQTVAIAYYSVIVPVSAQFGGKRPHQFRKLMMAMGSQPLPHAVNRTLQLLARSPSLHDGPSVAV